MSDSHPCWKCGRALAEANPGASPSAAPTSPPFCPHCGVIQDLPSGYSHFQVLGQRPGLRLDADRLREAFYALSRKVHPDKFATAPSPEPAYALRWSTAVNRAYQALRDPVARAHYLLELENFPVPTEAQVPLELAEAYFDLQDLLSEPQGEEKMAEFRGALQEQVHGAEEEWERLADAWESGQANPDRAGLLGQLQRLLTKQRYLRSMIADLERKGIHGHRGN